VSSTTPDQPADTTPDAAQVADEQSDETTGDTPEEHLLVDPGRVRRAPRYGAFFTVGAVVGVVAGMWLGLWLVDQVAASSGGPPVLKPGVFVTVVLLATTTVTVILAGLAAVLADRRSIRRR
jgi:hypothetical protein